MKVAVNGAAGAMGRRVVALVLETSDCQLVAALERPDHPYLGRDAGLVAGAREAGVRLSSRLEVQTDVLVDFSVPASALDRARECAQQHVPIVIGTTGLTDEQLAELRESVAAQTAVLVAPNMSLGVNLLYDLVERTAKALPPGYDVEIVEAHHRRKKDAPSGTAKELAKVLCRALGRDLSVLCYGREGLVGQRKPEEIAVLAVRGGDIVGDHTVFFAGDGEVLHLTHRATSRDVFARGALQAARFLADKKMGFYTMRDVLTRGR